MPRMRIVFSVCSVLIENLPTYYLAQPRQTNFVQTIIDKRLYKGAGIGLKFRTIFDQAG
ncbi:hypothetical protein FORC17_2581 [Vibrio vulnificus]|uniref:Uncharacterized protein n=1 Tax=Vibrio vulnificus TaxID=672 RepID=A0AAN1UD06_VIBVL|nr:hypothetical protein FORC16_0355 [Vibrio vulnificus]ANN27644.1 hypothetical protein FORC17_2581 [Vibrio vulnificus]AXX60910.1 hypothetical protein FORC53_2571 [Vibrio vulnificus]QBH28203.1 Hypothetical protein FORC77_2480 [Vibrio vulnificus]